MKYIRQTIIAGATAIRSVFSTTGERTKGQKRNVRVNLTPEKVQAVNLRNAIKKLTAILNENFTDGDYHITLTYAVEPTKEEAKENLRKFKKNMRERTKRKGILWKWVAATEYLNERLQSRVQRPCRPSAQNPVESFLCEQEGGRHHSLQRSHHSLRALRR